MKSKVHFVVLAIVIATLIFLIVSVNNQNKLLIESNQMLQEQIDVLQVEQEKMSEAVANLEAGKGMIDWQQSVLIEEGIHRNKELLLALEQVQVKKGTIQAINEGAETMIDIVVEGNNYSVNADEVSLYIAGQVDLMKSEKADFIEMYETAMDDDWQCTIVFVDNQIIQIYQ